jgi:hypothetical protein
MASDPPPRPEEATVKYMLLLRYTPGAGPEEGTPEFDAEMAAWGALNAELEAAGVPHEAKGLESDDAATTLRIPQGERVITDGPYAETREILFSFYIIDVADLDAALDWAAKMPCAVYGSVEVRPLSKHEQ